MLHINYVFIFGAFSVKYIVHTLPKFYSLFSLFLILRGHYGSQQSVLSNHLSELRLGTGSFHFLQWLL